MAKNCVYDMISYRVILEHWDHNGGCWSSILTLHGLILARFLGSYIRSHFRNTFTMKNSEWIGNSLLAIEFSLLFLIFPHFALLCSPPFKTGWASSYPNPQTYTSTSPTISSLINLSGRYPLLINWRTLETFINWKCGNLLEDQPIEITVMHCI